MKKKNKQTKKGTDLQHVNIVIQVLWFCKILDNF